MRMMFHPFTPDEAQQGAPTPSVYVTEAAAWEYKVLAREPEQETLPDEEALNELGAEGWELAAVVQHEGRATFYLKRLAR